MNRASFQNPRLVILSVAMIVVGGIAGFSTRVTREDPKSQIRWGYVTTALPGAEPAEVESLVSEPIERAIREAGTIRSIESSSLPGVSLVFIRLTDEVTDVTRSWLRIQDKLSQVIDQLPASASVPTLVDERRWGSDTTVVALTERHHSPVPPAVLSRWAKELNSRLSFVPGTRFTEVFGLPEEEVLVEIDEATIASTKLTAREIAERIRGRDSGVSDATSQSASHRMPVSSAGDITDLDALREIVVVNRGPSDDDVFPRQIVLGDVANIVRRERQPRRESVVVHGRKSVVIATRLDDSSAYGIGEWEDAQNRVLETFAAELPESLALTVIFDQKKYTDQRAGKLYQSLGLGMALVVIVVCLMMGWRATVPICAALPMTIGIVFLMMIPFGISLHQMSIAGLILALGMLIDNPIIVVDELQRRLDRDGHIDDALTKTIRHLAPPLMGSNLTTMLGFIPIVLIGGPTGEFMEQLGWCVIACLAGSLMLSLSIVPVVATWCLRPRWASKSTALQYGIHQPDRILNLQPMSRMGKVYHAFLIACQRYVAIVILMTCVVPGIGFYVAGSLKEQFFPGAERDHFYFSVRLPTHCSFDRTEAVALRAREVVMQHPEVEDVAVFVGRSSPKLHYSMVSLEDNRPNFAHCLVQLNTAEFPLAWIHQIQAELDETICEAQCVVTLIEQGPPAPAAIEFRIYGPDLETLHELGQRSQALLKQISGVVHTRSSLDPGGPRLSIEFSQTEVEQLGMADEAISRQVLEGVDGIIELSMSEGTEEIPIRVRLTDGHRSRVERIRSLPIITQRPPRKITTVNSLANVSIDQQLFNISRRNAMRCNIVYAYTKAGMLPIEIEDDFKRSLIQSEIEWPAGYRYDFGGTSAERNSAVGNLASYSAIVLVLMLAVLVLTLGSFRMAGIIFAVAVLSVGLGLASLWLFDYPIGIVGIIGLAGLLGLAVNDSIVVLRECQIGDDNDRPVAESVYSSTRHVLATSVTTVAGVLPLIWQGGDFWPPMMIVISGGIIGATAIALGFTPACYALLRPKRNPSLSVTIPLKRQLPTENVHFEAHRPKDSTTSLHSTSADDKVPSADRVSHRSDPSVDTTRGRNDENRVRMR